MLGADQLLVIHGLQYQLLAIGFPQPHFLAHHLTSASPPSSSSQPSKRSLSAQKFTNSERGVFPVRGRTRIANAPAKTQREQTQNRARASRLQTASYRWDFNVEIPIKRSKLEKREQKWKRALPLP